MSELIEKLRCGKWEYDSEAIALMDVAADEIERLQKELAEANKETNEIYGYLHRNFSAVSDVLKEAMRLRGFNKVQVTENAAIEYERDALRYRALRDSGSFVPSGFGGWALQCGIPQGVIKTGLDEAADRLVKRMTEQNK